MRKVVAPTQKEGLLLRERLYDIQRKACAIGTGESSENVINTLESLIMRLVKSETLGDYLLLLSY
jgi:hypothetical protein